MSKKFPPPPDPKEFVKLFPQTFIEAQLAQGMSRQELWSHFVQMWEWSVDPHKGKNRARTEKGWGMFGRNWLSDKAVNASKKLEAVKTATQENNSTQGILVRVSASCPKLNVEQLRLCARFLSGLTEAQQNEVFEQVMTDNLPDYVKPSHFQQAAVSLRNRNAMLDAPNVTMIVDDRSPEKLSNMYEKNGVTSIWELVELEKKKRKGK